MPLVLLDPSEEEVPSLTVLTVYGIAFSVPARYNVKRLAVLVVLQSVDPEASPVQLIGDPSLELRSIYLVIHCFLPMSTQNH